MPYNDEVLIDGPLGYWKLTDLLSLHPDSSPNGIALNHFNGSWTSGVAGLTREDSLTGEKCITMTSTTLAGTGDNALYSTSTFSAEAVFKPSSVAANRLIISRESQSAGTRHWRLGHNSSSKAIFGVYISGVLQQAVGATTLVNGTVYHVAGTWDGTTIKVYVNGALDGSTIPAAGTLDVSNQQVWGFALTNGTLPYVGSVEKIAVYGTALSGSRIAAHALAADSLPLVLSSGFQLEAVVPPAAVLSAGAQLNAVAKPSAVLSAGFQVEVGQVPLEFPAPDAPDLPGTFDPIPRAQKIKRRSEVYGDPVFVDGRLVSPWEPS